MSVPSATVFDELRAMPDWLEERLSGLDPAAAVQRQREDAFSPVEQCWHLADLEAEGYAVRVQRLLAERDPLLPDFDGAAVAAARDYRSRSLAEGLRAFRQARAHTLGLLASATEADWTRAGRQDGVGPVTLGGIPAMMLEHDRGHRAEIEAILSWGALASAPPDPPSLRPR